MLFCDGVCRKKNHGHRLEPGAPAGDRDAWRPPIGINLICTIASTVPHGRGDVHDSWPLDDADRRSTKSGRRGHAEWGESVELSYIVPICITKIENLDKYARNPRSNIYVSNNRKHEFVLGI